MNFNLKLDKQPLTAAGLTVGFWLSVLVSVLVTRQAEGVATIWLAGGFLTAGFLLLGRTWALRLAAVCFVLNFCTCALSGDPPYTTFAFGLLNLFEAAATAFVVRRTLGPALRLGNSRRVLMMVLGGIIAPCLITAAVAAAICAYAFHAPFQPVLRDWFMADATGLALTLPMLLIMLAGRRRDLFKPSRIEAAILLSFAAAATCLVFAQSMFSAPYIVFIALTVVAFRTGPRGVVAGGVIVATIAFSATLSGLALPYIGLDAPLYRRVHATQVYVVISFFTALAIATTVHNQARLRALFQKRVHAARGARAIALQASRAKTQFLATMSHEIRTPMNSIIGFTKLLLEDRSVPDAARRQLSLIDSAGASLLAVVNDILDFSKVEAGQIELVREPVSVRKIAQDAVAIAGESAAQKGLDLRLTLAGPVDTPLMADEMRVRQVLLNLLNNAVKFTSKGRIDLEAKVIAGDHVDTVHFQITDTGVGIPLDRRDRLFVRFSQVDGTVARHHGGTGLGLAICKGLVELMDGEIGVRSSPGQGSTFWFEVPMSRADEGTAAAEDAADDAPLAARILLVDDHPMNRELGGALLTMMGCDYDLAENGEEAVSAAATRAYDAILMDVHMPGMDGLAATRAIRASGGPNARVPIIAMTADVLPEQVARCFAAGMVGHVAKPVRPEALHEALAKALADTGDAAAVATTAA
ncbi:MAG: ATP-binding protein [Caulobacteraceae bacterium]